MANMTNEELDNVKMLGRGDYILCRTIGAGVHIGYYVEGELFGTGVVLAQARRIWSWNGNETFTLHEVSLMAPDERSNISKPVEIIELTTVIEKLRIAPRIKEKFDLLGWSGK